MTRANMGNMMMMMTRANVGLFCSRAVEFCRTSWCVYFQRFVNGEAQHKSEVSGQSLMMLTPQAACLHVSQDVLLLVIPPWLLESK
jgi:hypothetical protein